MYNGQLVEVAETDWERLVSDTEVIPRKGF